MRETDHELIEALEQLPRESVIQFALDRTGEAIRASEGEDCPNVLSRYYKKICRLATSDDEKKRDRRGNLYRRRNLHFSDHYAIDPPHLSELATVLQKLALCVSLPNKSLALVPTAEEVERGVQVVLETLAGNSTTLRLDAVSRERNAAISQAEQLLEQLTPPLPAPTERLRTSLLAEPERPLLENTQTMRGVVKQDPEEPNHNLSGD